MAIEFYDAVNGDGAFNILGKYFQALKTLNTARGTTIAADILDAVNQYKKKTDAPLAMDRAIEGLAAAEQSGRQALSVVANELRRGVQALIVEFVRADSTLPNPSLTESLEYFIAGMVAGDYKVDANTVGSSVSADGGNSATDVTIAVAHRNGDFNTQQNMLVETLVITAEGTINNPVLRVRGETTVSNSLSEEWPGGSGINTTIPILTSANSVAPNAGLEDWSNGVPDNWTIQNLGASPTTFRQTVYTEQTIIISGTPTSGYYALLFTDPVTSNVYATDNLAYNATAAQVQSALRTLPGLGSVTVTSTGTTPNYTHTVVFEGVAAAVAALSSTEAFDTGSIAHAITVTGDSGAVDGYGLVVAGTGDGLKFDIPLSPAARALYVCSVHFRSTVSGLYTINASLKSGIGGGDIEAENTDPMDEVFTASATGTLNQRLTGFFAIADDVTLPIYLELEVIGDEDITIDDVIIAPVQTVYPGGPTIVALRGKVPPAPDDTWTIPTTNNAAGELQTMFDRFCDMRGKRLLLPTSGANAIPDSVIS